MHAMNLTVHDDFPAGLRNALSQDLVETVVGLNGADYYVNAFDLTTSTFSLTATDGHGIPLPGAPIVKLAFNEVDDVQIY